MNSEEYSIFENDRAYVNPTISRDETLAFADTLKDVQAKDNAQIASQTQNLGTAAPSIQGGLGGSESYFQQRYQTIPSEVARANLRATAQAKALNDLMSNVESQYKNRYNQAYRSAQAKAAANKATANGGYNQNEGESGTAEYPGTMPIGSEVWGDRSVTLYSDIANNYRIYKDANTGEILKVLNEKNEPIDPEKDPYYRMMSDNMYHSTSSSEYQNALKKAQDENAFREITDLADWLFIPGFGVGKTIGGWITGK